MPANVTESMDRLRFKKNKFSALINKLEQRKLAKLLDQYPKYHPPHKSKPCDLSLDQARENHAFLMDSLPRRIEYIQTLLAEFSLHLDHETLSRDSIFALDAWAYQYWGVVYSKKLFQDIYFGYPFNFQGRDLAVRSMILDVALLIGEIYVAKNVKAKWELDETGSDSHEQSTEYHRTVMSVRSVEEDKEILNNLHEYEGSFGPRTIDLEAHTASHFGSQHYNDALILMDQKMENILGKPLLEYF